MTYPDWSPLAWICVGIGIATIPSVIFAVVMWLLASTSDEIFATEDELAERLEHFALEALRWKAQAEKAEAERDAARARYKTNSFTSIADYSPAAASEP